MEYMDKIKRAKLKNKLKKDKLKNKENVKKKNLIKFEFS
jgi:hypothetical protein